MKTEKEKSENKATFKDILLEVGVELVLALSAFAIGALVLSFAPSDIIVEAPELAMFLGGIILTLIAALVAIPIFLVKRHRKMKDFRRIQKSFRGKYELKLVIRNKRIRGARREVPVIKGNNSEGMFELYKDEDKYIFNIEYFKMSVNENIVTRQLDSEAEAIECIEKFMTEKI